MYNFNYHRYVYFSPPKLTFHFAFSSISAKDPLWLPKTVIYHRFNIKGERNLPFGVTPPVSKISHTAFTVTLMNSGSSAISGNSQGIKSLTFPKQMSWEPQSWVLHCCHLYKVFLISKEFYLQPHQQMFQAKCCIKVIFFFFLEKKIGREDERVGKVIYLHQFSGELISEELFFLLIIYSKGFLLLLQSLNFLE